MIEESDREIFDIIRKNYHEANKDYIEEQIKVAESYLTDKKTDYENKNYDPDRCYECIGLGDDVYITDEGEIESWCDQCSNNPHKVVNE